jgi:hypothetical protein
MLFLVILIFIIIIIIFKIYQNNYQTPTYHQTHHQTSKNSCICAFDLDNTLIFNDNNNVGLSHASNAINTCKKNNCILSIITARPIPFCDDLNHEVLGIYPTDFKNDFYFGDDIRNCTMINESCIANNKTKHLRHLSKKYNVDPKNIILFDDQYYNYISAIDNGFSSIKASEQNGLPPNVDQLIDNLLK